jgi:hypothetical protein
MTQQTLAMAQDYPKRGNGEKPARAEEKGLNAAG